MTSPIRTTMLAIAVVLVNCSPRTNQEDEMPKIGISREKGATIEAS